MQAGPKIMLPRDDAHADQQLGSKWNDVSTWQVKSIHHFKILLYLYLIIILLNNKGIFCPVFLFTFKTASHPWYLIHMSWAVFKYTS